MTSVKGCSRLWEYHTLRSEDYFILPVPVQYMLECIKNLYTHLHSHVGGWLSKCVGGCAGGRNSQLASLSHFVCNVSGHVECSLYIRILTYALYV